MWTFSTVHPQPGADTPSELGRTAPAYPHRIHSSDTCDPQRTERKPGPLTGRLPHAYRPLIPADLRPTPVRGYRRIRVKGGAAMAHEAFGRRVRDARLAKQLTAAELAAQLWPGVSEREVHRWEAGEREPVGRTRRDLAVALSKPFWELWPPQETADRMTVRNTRRVLLEARTVQRGGTALYVRADAGEDLAGARALARLDLAEDMGRDPGSGHRLYRLTGMGEEVRDLLVAEVQSIPRTNGSHA